MRYKDGKGHPRGFNEFLDSEKLPRGMLPRYRENRLHILFHICGKLTEHYEKCLHFLQTELFSCGGSRSAIASNFATDVARVQIHVLGLFGKLLTGPWMRKLYTLADFQLSHIQAIHVVRKLLDKLKINLYVFWKPVIISLETG